MSTKRPLSPEPPIPSRDDSSFSYAEAEQGSFVSRESSVEQTCLPEDRVQAILRRKEQAVMEALCIKRPTARLLLSRTQPPWDEGKLCDAWFDKGICAIQCLVAKQCLVKDEGGLASCLVCGPCGVGEVMFPLSCRHMVCTDCLTNFLGSKLHPSDGSPPLMPPYTCKDIGGSDDCGPAAVLDVEEVADLPLDDTDKALIETTLDSGMFRKCHACPKLNRPATGQVNLRCECGAHYCFACGQDACVGAGIQRCNHLADADGVLRPGARIILHPAEAEFFA